MNKAFGNCEPALEAYTYATFAPEDSFLRDVRERQVAAGLPDIQVAPLDGLHLEVFARLVGARRAVEIGTLGGYSGTCLLRGMPDDATLDTFEIDPRHAEVARETFRRAGFAGRATVHVGAAMDLLPSLSGPYDLCFIDADKASYPRYVAWAADRLRIGGAVLLDNAFLFGTVVQEDSSEPSVLAMRKTHHMLVSSGRWRATMIPTGEGLAVGVRVK